MIKLAIVGYRNYNDYNDFSNKINNWIKEKNITVGTIISGGASGTDSLAERYAKENKIKIIIYHADWNKYGKAAGPLRNTKIVDNSTHVVAFVSKNSIGTYDTINKAKNKKLIVKVFQID